jgi:hypothetical protein
VTVNHSPTCSLAVQGTETSSFVTLFTVKAIAVCTDPQASPLTTTITWGDGSPPSTGAGGSLTATHTYTAPLAASYTNIVSATDGLGMTGSATYSTILIPASSVPGVFSGQSADFGMDLPASSSSVQVTFECTTLTDSSGNVMQASTVGINCTTTPAVVTLGAAQAIQVGIQTTGFAVARLRAEPPSYNWSYAICLPLPGLLLLAGRRRRLAILGILLVVAIGLGGCGAGGFTVPSKTPPPTPTGADNYQLTIVDNPVNPNVNGFVQTSLIVPLTVSPTQ